MLRSLMLLSLLCSTWGVGSAWAQLAELELGKVYHFTNAMHTNYAIGVNSSEEVRGITPVSKADYNQLWRVAEKDASGNYRLQSVGHGGYLQAKGQETEWLLVDKTITTDTYLVLGVDESNSYNVFRGVNYNGGKGWANLNINSRNVIWGWSYSGDNASKWTIEEVELDEAALDKALDNQVLVNSTIREAVTTALSNLFTDVACTTAKKSLTVAALEADADYQALTPTLQKMAKKVYSTADDAWTESNFDNNNKDAWDNDYAKKYRVQWYEPYTEPECAASALRINAHTNLNNPTGIFANSGDVLFVMVEGEIKEGAYLYLASYTGHNKLGGYASGVELHQGLNVIPVSADGTNYCINYVVKTFDASKGTGKNAIIEGRELSNYPDLQIHIEGGYINGYWNKMGDNASHNGDFNYTADTDADWDYIKARATQTDVTILGEYVTLQFPLTDEGTVDDKGMASLFNSYNDGTTTVTTSLKASIDEWDKVMIWERLLMGVVGEDVINNEDVKSPYSNHPKVTAYTGRDADLSFDYSKYYRVHGLSFGTEGGYMYGSWDHCGYNFSTMPSIMVSMVNESGPHWGPAHEIGHQHQGPLNMRGLTEVTNNLFSNVVLWYYGKSTARYNGTDGALSNVLAQFNAEGTDFFSNNIWAQTIMYYKLFLYYHVLGYNPKFYPRLFELLRQNPMTIEYEQDGGKCLMHFYKLCCDAAGEDLTEFFRAHGFFEVMEERFVGDYSNAVYTMTQAQIDQAIAEVKAHNYPQNLSVLFITDATGEGNIKSNRGDDVYLTHFDTNNSGNLISGELGNYATFNTVTAPNYNYSISGNTVTMEGSGGVGFAILNEKGELIGFSDKKTFEISQETMEAISNGEATIAVMPASGEPVPAVSTMSESDIERTLLADLIEQAETMVALIDDEGKKIGFYKSSYTTELESSLMKAQEVYENREENAYTPAFNALKAVMDDLKSKAYAKIAMKAGVYTLRNQAYPARYMSVNASNKLITTANAELTDAEKWTFEQGNGQGHYYIKSVSTGKYINALEKSKEVNATTTEILDAKEWLVEDLGNGVFGITCQDDNNQSIHCDAGHKIVGWNTGATASRWYLTALETEALSAEQQALEELIVLSEDMLKRVATIETATEGFALDANSYYCNAPMTANWYGDGFQGYHVLFDEDYSTYLHTDYTGKDSGDGLDHYLRVDLGENNSASLFTFYYATRNSSKQNPTVIVVEGCNTVDGEYEVIANLTREADNLIAGAESEYISAVLGQANKSYRYLRFRVTATVSNEKAGPEDGKKYIFFVFSEFGVSKAICSVTPLAKYSTLTSDYVTEVFNKIREVKYVYANADNAADYTAAKEALQPYYNRLLDVYNTQESTALDAKKEALQTLINQAKALIYECGSVEPTEETTPQLNTTVAPYKLSDNNGASKGSLDKLYDGLQGEANSYTSNWSATPTEASYLQVDLGSGNELEELIFTFTNRNEGNAPTPTEIVVSASTDGSVFTELATFTSAESNWPPAANSQNITATKWTSPVIEATSACRYWRFTVTESDRSSGDETNSNGIYHFGISEFGIVIPASLNVTVNPGMGEVNEALMLDTYKETQEAFSTKKFATTEAQVDRAIAQLQAQYDVLLEAKNNQYAQALRDKISKTEALIAECGRVENGEVVEVLETAGDATKTLILATYDKVAEAQALLDAGGATQSQYEKATAALEAQRAELQAATEKTTKAGLRAAVAAMVAKIAECGTVTPNGNGEGYVVTLNYAAAGDVTTDDLIDAYEAKIVAEAILRASELTDYTDATAELNTAKSDLERAKAGTVRSTLRTLTNNVTALITLCNDAPGDVSEVMLSDLSKANQEALTLLQGDGLTAIAEKTIALQAQYDIAVTAQQATGKSTLSSLIANMETLISECTTGEGYVGDVTADLLSRSIQAKDAAQAVVNANNTTTADFETATETLQERYNTLDAAKKSTAKAELREKISELAELIEKCHVTGTNIVTRSEVCTLQADNSGADFYISTNATDSEGEIRNLVDGDTNTFFQTKSSVGVEHYLLVDAGENNKLKKFTFSYRPCKSPFPYTIVVYGSNDNSTFKELATFTDLPTTDDQNWESSEIGNGTAYRYLRFNITKSGVAIKVDDNKELDTSVGEQLSNKYKSTLSAATPQVEYCFAMSEFALTNIVDEEQEIEILAGTVTEDQLTDAAQANADATTLANTSAVAKDLNDKKDALQDIYDALYAAYGIHVNLVTTVENRDQLLSNIEWGKTLSTFSAPYATEIPDDVEAYYATQKYNGDGTVWLTRVETKVLPANQGVILIGNVGCESVNFYPAAEESQEDLSQNIFSNTASGPVTSGSADYILANGKQGIGIYKAKEGITIGQFKAFIRLDAGNATQKLVLRFGGTTTDIEDVPTVILPEDIIYDLSGHRVNEVTKGGVYIVNGKKVFIK